MAKTFRQPFTGRKVTIGDGGLDLVAVYEIEERFGLTRGQVHRLVHAGDFPEPLADLRVGRIWNAEDVEQAIGELRLSGRLSSNMHIVPWRFTPDE